MGVAADTSGARRVDKMPRKAVVVGFVDRSDRSHKTENSLPLGTERTPYPTHAEKMRVVGKIVVVVVDNEKGTLENQISSVVEVQEEVEYMLSRCVVVAVDEARLFGSLAMDTGRTPTMVPRVLVTEGKTTTRSAGARL